MDLTRRSDQELLSDVGRLVGSHRVLTAKLVAYLAEIEHRRLHLEAGFPSMFEYCVKWLGLSEGEAYRRIVAARLSRRFPSVCRLLESGRVHLSALELLREHLTDENHDELFEAVSGMSKRDIEAVLATRFPKPDAPSRITRARIEPLSEARFKVEFTARAALREKLERCRDLMSHANPSRGLPFVVERAVDLLLEKLERERLARTKRPATKQPTEATNPRAVEREESCERAEPSEPSGTRERRVVARATRRLVFERDGARCTYVSPDGRRCDSRAFLELDHAEPRALGGQSSAENLRVRCRAHNQLAAEYVFGREYVEERKHFRQRKLIQETNAPHEATFEKARLALKGLGFGDGEARRAVAKIAADAGLDASLEEVFRSALLAATRAA